MNELNETTVFEIFPWDNNFETGIELIDEQHKKLVEILNQLAVHLANRSKPIVLNKIFKELADYADYHFKSEEKIWASHLEGDEWYTEHLSTHESFISNVIALKEEEKDKPLDDVIQDIVSFLSKWLAFHILDSDKRLAKAVLSIQSGNNIEQAKIHANEEMGGSMKVLINTVLSMYENLSTRTLDLMREKALRRQAEESLLRSEERWKFILESGGEDVWDWDIRNEKEYPSQKDVPIFELLAKKIQGFGRKSIIHPEDIDRVEADFMAHIRGETEFYSNKHRVLQGNGSWAWMLTRGKVVSRDEDGQALRMVGTNSDITKHELAALIYQHSSQAMFISDAQNNIISINPAFTKITGYTERDVIGKTPGLLASGKHDKTFYHQMWDSINDSGQWTGEIWNKRKNGEIYPENLSINTVLGLNGQLDHYLALFTDITGVKRDSLRTDLLDSLLLATLATHSADDLLRKTLDLLTPNKLLEINGRGAIFKVPKIGANLELLYQKNLSADAIKKCAVVPIGTCHCGRAAETGEIQYSTGIDDKHEIIYSGIKPHGHYVIPIKLNTKILYVIMLELYDEAIIDSEGIKFFNTISDILTIAIKRLDSDKKLLQSKQYLEQRVKERTGDLASAVEEANRANMSKSEFLASMSHELRTPLHGILSFSNFGINRSDTVSREKLHQYFTNIHSSAERLLALINDLLDLSKLEAGKMELDINEANLIAVFESCYLEQSQRIKDLGLTLQFDKPADPVLAMFDAVRIGQVITNLLSNAIKFSPYGGVISVTINKNDRQELCFSLQDQGAGIPKGDVEKIFDSFTQVKQHKTNVKGTGLGLSISNKIIQSHYGRIWVENAPEGGAIFRFVIP